MPRPARDPRLYNQQTAAAFRREARKRTRLLSEQRHFLNEVARALAGGPPAYWRGIHTEERCVLLGSEKTKQYWGVVSDICDSIPALRWMPTEFFYLGIFASRQEEA